MATHYFIYFQMSRGCSLAWNVDREGGQTDGPVGLRWPKPDWVWRDCQYELLGKVLVRTYSIYPKAAVLIFRVLLFRGRNWLKLKLANQDKNLPLVPAGPSSSCSCCCFKEHDQSNTQNLLVRDTFWESFFPTRCSAPAFPSMHT